MSCYSVPKCLVHVLFGGTAIWLGTTFCSPLAATELELPPTPVSAPDALATPEQPVVRSSIPAAPLESESADHWDTGPTVDEAVCADDIRFENECGDECCDGYAYSYEYAQPAETYAANADSEQAWANSQQDTCSYDDACNLGCGYDDEMAALDGNMAATEEAIEEDSQEEYSYGFEDEYGHDEEFAQDYDEVYGTEQEEVDTYVYDEEDYEDYGYDEEYVYDYEDEYGYDDGCAYGEEDMDSPAVQPEEAVDVAATKEDTETAEEEFSYEFDDYETYYGYEYDKVEANEVADEAVTDEAVADEAVAETEQEIAEESAESQEADWEDYYYEDEYDYYDDECELAEEAAEEAADEAVAETEQETAQESAESQEADWENYYYEGEYGDYDDEYELAGEESSESQPAAEEMVEDESPAEETWADEYDYEKYDYDSYTYDANEYEYDMDDTLESEPMTEEAVESFDDSYGSVDPIEQYEYDLPGESEAEAASEPEFDLFAMQPGQLLQDADRDLIRSLEALSGQPSAVRRARLNDYIEALGFESIDFAYRYEDAADADVLAFADDLPGAATFLACYRLVEQGNVAMDDAVVILEDSIAELSLEWIEEVGEITASADDASPVSHPVVEALSAAATRSIEGANTIATAISQRISAFPWSDLPGRLEEIRSAFRPLRSDDAIQF